MKLQKMAAWLTDTFEPPVPCSKTARRWFALGKLNGRMIEGKLYIDCENPFTEGGEPPKKYVPLNKIN